MSADDNGKPRESIRPRWKDWRIMLPVWGVMGLLLWLGLRFEVDAPVIAGGLFIFGLLLHAFDWVVGIVLLVPVIGPLVVKLLSASFIWVLNAIGYLVAFVAIRRGYSRDVLTYRGLTIALLVGIVIGYVLGKLV